MATVPTLTADTATATLAAAAQSVNVCPFVSMHLPPQLLPNQIVNFIFL